MKGFVEVTWEAGFVSQSPHSGILVVEHAEGGARVCEKICAKH